MSIMELERGTAVSDASAATVGRAIDAGGATPVAEMSSRPRLSSSEDLDATPLFGVRKHAVGFGFADEDLLHSFGTSVVGEPENRRAWASRAAPVAPAGSGQGDNPFDTRNEERLTLLARKYAGGAAFSKEEKARLAIVTERVRQLMPATTMKDIEALEGLLDLSDRVSAADKSIRQRLARLG